MTPRLFVVPYDSGHRGARMGAGPLAIAGRLPFPSTEIEPESDWRAEIRTSFELYRGLARGVRAAVGDGAFPVVLAGNCGACIGTAAGLGAERLAVLWLDAHGDFMTPETTTSGFLDGMGMSIVTGRCWQTLASSIPHFRPVDPRAAMHAGGRDWSDGEREAFDAAGVACVEAAAIRERGVDAAIAPALDALAQHADRLLFHVDLDVIDRSFGAANEYVADGGLSPDDVLRILELASARIPLAALELASYDPRCDAGGAIGDAAARIVRAIC